jgi:fatty acid desaturase
VEVAELLSETVETVLLQLQLLALQQLTLQEVWVAGAIQMAEAVALEEVEQELVVPAERVMVLVLAAAVEPEAHQAQVRPEISLMPELAVAVWRVMVEMAQHQAQLQELPVMYMAVAVAVVPEALTVVPVQVVI